MDGMCELMAEMAKKLRVMADELDQAVDDGYRGENPKRYGSSGDVVEGREVEDITENDISDAVKIIKIGL